MLTVSKHASPPPLPTLSDGWWSALIGAAIAIYVVLNLEKQPIVVVVVDHDQEETYFPESESICGRALLKRSLGIYAYFLGTADSSSVPR